jgi:Zn-dependent M28 family amino/carboxypeptidase
MARVIASVRPPRRSILFLFSTAEESGLLGARHFLADPPLPTSRMVADVNVDGLAFMDTFADLVAVGSDHSDLDERLEQAVRPLGLTLGVAPRELWLQEGFARSDQLAFAEAGVPAVMVNEGFSWDHLDRRQAVARALEWIVTRYHTPADDLEQELSYAAARLHTQAILALVLTLADDPTPPRWDPQTPYAYERALALARGR